MKSNNLILCLAMGAGLVAQPLVGLGQNSRASASRTNDTGVVVLPAGGGTGDTNSVSTPRDPAVNVAVAYETLQVIRARAAANTNAPRVSVDQIRERTESVLDELIKQLQTTQGNGAVAPAGLGVLAAGPDQSDQTAPAPLLVARPVANRSIEERLAALEVRVNGHAQRLQEVEHKITFNH